MMDHCPTCGLPNPLSNPYCFCGERRASGFSTASPSEQDSKNEVREAMLRKDLLHVILLREQVEAMNGYIEILNEVLQPPKQKRPAHGEPRRK